MKTFEERFTAWVDGQLTGEELARFETELANHTEAVADKDEAIRLGHFLRARPTAPPLTNGDFFNLQIEQRIASARRPERVERRSWFSIPRLSWAGVASLLVAGILAKWMIPTGSQPVSAEGSPYFAQVVEAWPGDAGISASTVYDPRENVTVLWLDGLDYIPATYALK